MPGAIAALEELFREKSADDRSFLQEHLVFFEIRVEEGLIAGSYLYPLVVPPKRSSIEERALVDYSLTVTGGVAVEENGVPRAPMRLSGNFGWKPKDHRIPPNIALLLEDSANEGKVRASWSPLALSGKRHVEMLHEVFRAYWRRKKDPDKGPFTRMIYHCPTENEHWLIIPEVFRSERSESNPVGSADWEIAFSTVAPAEEVDADFSPDKSLWEQIKDFRARVRSALDLMGGMVSDITSVIGEIRSFVQDIDAVMSTHLRLIADVNSLVDAGARLTGAVIRRARDHSAQLEDLSTLFETNDAYRHIRSALLDGADGTAMIAMYPADTSEDVGLPAAPAVTTTPTGETTNALTEGSGNLPGDAARARATAADSVRRERVFSALVDHEIKSTDTLESIAATYLGDPGEWRRIAALNGLEEPYLSTVAFPGTVQPGGRILVPSRGANPGSGSVPSVARAEQTSSLETRVFGRDIAVRLIPGTTRYGYVLTDSGDDYQVVSGRACFVQGLEIRTRTLRGSDGLYPSMGVLKVVGVRFRDVTREMENLRVAEAVRADPRVAAVRVLPIDKPQPDAVRVKLEVIPRGLGIRVPINVGALPGAKAA